MNITQKPHLHQDWIDPHAVGIVRALQKKGFTTYLVGGCVRDLLLGVHPKDFDIATNAQPDEVRRTIHRAYIIGKRFRLVLVRRDDMQFEVATFRREVTADEIEQSEEPPQGDNLFGSPEEDARRRDFTINGLFYDPINDQLIDYAEGLPDLKEGWVRMIGDPTKRLKEDPIRILRALRLKHMIQFMLEPELRKAMHEQAATLSSAVLPRRREEILKLLRLKDPCLAFREAYDLGILAYISPTLNRAIEGQNGELFFELLNQCASVNANLSAAELFGLMVHAFARAFVQTEPIADSKAKHSLENETFQGWMREELGMFKFEQTLAVKALLIEPLLAKRREFQKRGERRQRALVANEAFPMALTFCKRDFQLSTEDVFYWTERYDELKFEGGYDQPRPKRRRTRRPRKNQASTEARS